MKTDEQICTKVRSELAADPRVDASKICVSVHQGLVTLGGQVSSWLERQGAERTAGRVAGVRDVMNDLLVHLPPHNHLSDSELIDFIRDALHANALVPAERIEVKLQDGVVTLEGTVDYWSQHDDAEQAIAKLRGIRELRNHIVVEPPVVGRQEVKGAIHEALDRRADRLTKGIQVAVHGSSVVISGVVASAAERRTIESAVEGTAGVASVENQLRVAPQ